MKPENRMLNRIKPKIESRLDWYIEKTNNPYRGGTPDWYVEWDGGCGWIEAKYWNIKTEGKNTLSASYICDKMVSALQDRWLERVANHGIPAGVLCGFPDTKHYMFFHYPIAWKDMDIHSPIITLDGLMRDLYNFQTGRYESEKTL